MLEVGSTVFMAALGNKKAFDTVNHIKMFSSLINIRIPRSVVAILNNWYCKLFVIVIWGSSYSTLFSVISDVHQRCVLSPTLFNIFINLFTVYLRHLNIGCHIKSMFVGCLRAKIASQPTTQLSDV